jgi:hypothetical protein
MDRCSTMLNVTGDMTVWYVVYFLLFFACRFFEYAYAYVCVGLLYSTYVNYL